MRYEDVKLRYAVIIDDLAEISKHSGELPPGSRTDDYDEIVNIMLVWCEQQFGKRREQWDHRLDEHTNPMEDWFSFQEEHQRTLFVLRWS